MNFLSHNILAFMSKIQSVRTNCLRPAFYYIYYCCWSQMNDDKESNKRGMGITQVQAESLTSSFCKRPESVASKQVSKKKNLTAQVY